MVTNTKVISAFFQAEPKSCSDVFFLVTIITFDKLWLCKPKIKLFRCLFTTYERGNSTLNILSFLLRNANGLTAFFITFDTLCKFWSSVC